MSQTDTAQKVKKHFVFLLLGEFTMTAFANAVEPLRIANRFSETQLYTWSFIGETGETLECSNGAIMQLHGGLCEVAREDTIVICGGMNIRKWSTKPILNWLRREQRKGVAIAGVDTGSYTMALAGLLDGKRGTIHWENRDSFSEEFVDVELVNAVYTVDGNRLTSAGGAAALDMMLYIVSRDQGQELANWVADQMLYNSIRTDRDEQRLSIPTRIGVRHPKLSTVIQVMEANLEEPISPRILAQDVGMSTRQLERLFRRYLDRSPKRYYMEMRLQKARNLLMQTDMSVINVALACGFSSPSHFSKCYRSHYSITPYRERGAMMATPV